MIEWIRRCRRAGSGLRAVRLMLVLVSLGWGVGAVGVPGVSAQGLPAQRVIQGKVYGPSGSAQQGAVVYLKDEKSLEIKTYITTQDGTYRFGQLGSQNDYQLWAEFGGHKSKNKNISSFDTKKLFDVSLQIQDK